jgi:hypothetical protein
MEKANDQATPWLIYALWAVVFANGVMYSWSPRASWRPLGILMVFVAVAGVVLTLEKRNRVAALAVRVANTAIWLGCTVAVIAGRRWIVGLVFFGFGALPWIGWRREYLRRRNAPQAAP